MKQSSFISKISIKKIFTFLIILFLVCSKNTQQHNYIAKYKDLKIDSIEFNYWFNNSLLYSNFLPDSNSTKKIIKKIFLQKIIYQKNKNPDSILNLKKYYINSMKNKIIIEQFYEKIISSKIPEYNDSIIRKYFIRSKAKYKVKIIYAKKKQIIDSLYREIVRVNDFDKIYFLLNKKYKFESDWLSWGTFDKTLEDTIYSLKVGQFSKPIKTLANFYIIKLENMRYNPIIDENEFQRKKIKIYKKWKRLYENKLADDYINEKLGMKKIHVYSKGAQVLNNILNNKIHLSEEAISHSLQNTAVAQCGKLVLTVNDILNNIYNIPNKNDINNVIKIALRDKFLLNEAKKFNLENSYKTKILLKSIKENIIFNFYFNNQKKLITISQDEIKYYYNKYKEKFIKQIYVEGFYKTFTNKYSAEIFLKKLTPQKMIYFKWTIKNNISKNAGEKFILYKTFKNIEINKPSNIITWSKGFTIFYIKHIKKEYEKLDNIKDKLIEQIRQNKLKESIYNLIDTTKIQFNN